MAEATFVPHGDTTVFTPQSSTTTTLPPPPAKEPAASVEPVVEPAVEPPKKKAKTQRKRGPKSYRVAIPHGDEGKFSMMYATKSAPRAATSAAIRGAIKSLPLRTPVTVYTRSKSLVHKYIITRDYDNPKQRGFSIESAKSFALSTARSSSESLGIPKDLLV